MLACLLALLTYLLFRDDVSLQHGAALQPSADTHHTPHTTHIEPIHIHGGRARGACLCMTGGLTYWVSVLNAFREVKDKKRTPRAPPMRTILVFLSGMNGQDNGSGSSRNAMPCDGIVHWQICHRSLFGASYV